MTDAQVKFWVDGAKAWTQTPDYASYISKNQLFPAFRAGTDFVAPAVAKRRAGSFCSWSTAYTSGSASGSPKRQRGLCKRLAFAGMSGSKEHRRGRTPQARPLQRREFR